MRLGDGALEDTLVVRHGLGDSHNPVFLNEVRELGRFHHIRRNVIVFHRKLVCQLHSRCAVGSRGSNKDLEVEWFGERGKGLLRICGKAGIFFGHHEDRF
jgi:hypothetical protein